MGNESSVLRSSGWKEPARTTDRCRRSNVVSWCTGSTNRVLFRDRPLGILQTRDSDAPLSLAILRIFLFLFFFFLEHGRFLLENENLTKLRAYSCYLTGAFTRPRHYFITIILHGTGLWSIAFRCLYIETKNIATKLHAIVQGQYSH